MREITPIPFAIHPVGHPPSDKIEEPFSHRTSTHGEDVTQLNSFEELLDQLDANPEWRKVLKKRFLSEELATQPATFDGFAKSTGNRRDHLEGDIDTIMGDQAPADAMEQADILAADLNMIYLRILNGAELNRIATAAQRAALLCVAPDRRLSLSRNSRMARSNTPPASVRNTRKVQELGDSGAIHWYTLEYRGPAQAEE